jgi:hypothetical protein
MGPLIISLEDDLPDPNDGWYAVGTPTQKSLGLGYSNLELFRRLLTPPSTSWLTPGLSMCCQMWSRFESEYHESEDASDVHSDETISPQHPKRLDPFYTLGRAPGAPAPISVVVIVVALLIILYITRSSTLSVFQKSCPWGRL